MPTEIVPITRQYLASVVKACAKWGMPRSVGWLERCMFAPAIKDLVCDEIRGHMFVRDDGEPVAIPCYYYMSGYFKQRRILINTGCIMGADPRCGEELL